MLVPSAVLSVRHLPVTSARSRRVAQRLARLSNVVSEGCARGCSRSRTDASRLPWQSNGEFGGWGGRAYPELRSGDAQPPIVFVHGNRRDSCDWIPHGVYFRKRGVSRRNLWAITFRQRTPTHDEMAAQLESFVASVKQHTGAPQVSLVAHSLGATGVRHWLDRYDRYESVDTFVAIAGANHGLKLCTEIDRMRLRSGPFKICRYLRHDYDRLSDHPLANLNEGTETPGDVSYYTIRGANDPLFRGCRDSPRLEGAVENVVLDTDHNGTRESSEAMEHVYEWVVE